MNKRIVELQKFAEIGRISPSLFHDILNPLTGLMLYFDSIEKRDDKKIQSQLDSVIESSKNIREFIKIIQEFIYGQKPEIINIDEIIQNVIKIMATKAHYNHVSIVLLRKNKVRTKCPPIFLYQILINLISNAIDAYNEVKDSRDRRINIILEKIKNDIVIKIIDNGIGIKEEESKKIFDPFYTTKETGTGIGLPTVKNIVEKEFKGNIQVESTYNKGTVFKILLPIKNPE